MGKVQAAQCPHRLSSLPQPHAASVLPVLALPLHQAITWLRPQPSPIPLLLPVSSEHSVPPDGKGAPWFQTSHRVGAGSGLGRG